MKVYSREMFEKLAKKKGIPGARKALKIDDKKITVRKAYMKPIVARKEMDIPNLGGEPVKTTNA